MTGPVAHSGEAVDGAGSSVGLADPAFAAEYARVSGASGGWTRYPKAAVIPARGRAT
jgi:hypothetical protein